MYNRGKRNSKPAELSKVRAYVYRRLAEREWGYARLLTKMKQRFPGNKENELTDVLDEFVDDGGQSDTRYAECYMRQCRDMRGYGPNKVKAKLYEHQISGHIIDQFLFEDHPIWDLRAHEQRHKKFGPFPDDAEARAKQSRFLQQRGFTFAQIKQAMTPGMEHSEEGIIPPEDDNAEPISLGALLEIFQKGERKID